MFFHNWKNAQPIQEQEKIDTYNTQTNDLLIANRSALDFNDTRIVALDA